MSTKNTRLTYLYRDASNYKAVTDVVVKGRLTNKQKDKIMESLLDGEYFIPEQLGLPITRPDDKITDDDHCYCEIDEDDSFELTNDEPTKDISIAQLATMFANAGKEGWDDVKYSPLAY